MLNDQHFWESWSLQQRNDTKMSPQLKSFFFIVTSIVYGYHEYVVWYMNMYLKIQSFF